MTRNIKYLQKIVYVAMILALLASCSSSTLIESNPPGARVYLDGESVGVTPYRMTDTKILGSKTEVKLDLEGYEVLKTNIVRNEDVDVGAVIGGIFFAVPFLWTMEYKPYHTYDLIPMGSQRADGKVGTRPAMTKEEKLQELKDLLDKKLITEEDYAKMKQRILEANQRP